ncbi:hypothetical protein IFM89_022299, partial [Coptis chinensis]
MSHSTYSIRSQGSLKLKEDQDHLLREARRRTLPTRSVDNIQLHSLVNEKYKSLLEMRSEKDTVYDYVSCDLLCAASSPGQFSWLGQKVMKVPLLTKRKRIKLK